MEDYKGESFGIGMLHVWQGGDVPNRGLRSVVICLLFDCSPCVFFAFAFFHPIAFLSSICLSSVRLFLYMFMSRVLVCFVFLCVSVCSMCL